MLLNNDGDITKSIETSNNFGAGEALLTEKSLSSSSAMELTNMDEKHSHRTDTANLGGYGVVGHAL